MSDLKTYIDPEAIEKLMLEGDLSRLTPEQRIQYYRMKCESIGIDHTQTPFQYIRLSGKLTLYATKNCAEQLRDKHLVSITDLQTKEVDGIFIVTVTAQTPEGRSDTDCGAVPIEGLNGERKANAMLKGITKAKRRVTLSLLGLGMLDETEVETIPDAEIVTEQQAMQIEASAVEEPLLETLQIGAELSINKVSVTKVEKKTAGKHTWWTIDIDHLAKQFTTFSETYATIAIDAYADDTPIAVLLEVKKKRDGNKIFNCKALAPYIHPEELQNA